MKNIYTNPTHSRTSKLSDNSIEKGIQNGHMSNNSKKSSPQLVASPRVTLQSSRKTPRPRSTVPNFIGKLNGIYF